jgi:membrane-bound lytic murein transglycosylase F
MSGVLRSCGLPLLGSAIVIFSCSSPKQPEFTELPNVTLDIPQIIARGHLNVLVDNNSVSYFIYRGEPMGYEYELLQRFSDFLKVELKIRIISGVEEAVDLLNNGEGDIIAFPLTVTQERKAWVDFTDTHFTTSQVLVQRKPADWRTNPDSADRKLIRNLPDLIGKEVHVMKGGAFKQRLENLSQEIGGQIIVIEDSADAETESLVRRVASGDISYTVTDQTFAMVNANYFPDLDIATVVSLPQQIAWAVRLNSPALRDSVNTWMSALKRTGTYRIIYSKYFNSPRTSLRRMTSDYSSLSGGKLSRFDETIKTAAGTLGWDWRLIASICYQESGFNPSVTSWAGASGLMQLMPAVAVQFKVDNVMDPVQNVMAGARVLKYLDRQWEKSVEDPKERLRFVLASYNAGLSHVIDARNLARKYGKNPAIWADNVEYYLRQKTNPKFYRDPVAIAGYCRCEGPVNYVKEVLGRFEEYKMHIE